MSSRSRVVHGAASLNGACVSEYIAEVVPIEKFNAFLREEERPDNETHLDDKQWLDGIEIQYVE